MAVNDDVARRLKRCNVSEQLTNARARSHSTHSAALNGTVLATLRISRKGNSTTGKQQSPNQKTIFGFDVTFTTP